MASIGPGPGLIGTRLNLLLDIVDGAIGEVYADLGLPGFRPRFTPPLRVIAAAGSSSIRDIARATGVTHSAASQTVARMVKADLVTVRPGADARTRIVSLTPAAQRLLPTLDAEYAATTAAAIALEAEMTVPLSRAIDEALDALARRSMRQRIADADPDLIRDHAVAAAVAGQPNPDPPDGTS